MTAMHDLLMNLTYDIIYILAAVIAVFVIGVLERKLGTEKMKQIESELAAKQELAILAVRFVEQAYKDLHGQAKYNHAAAWLSGRAMEVGLTISDQEIKGLIEAALRSLKDEFGEEWAKTTG
jgi:LL-H family phage holin